MGTLRLYGAHPRLPHLGYRGKVVATAGLAAAVPLATLVAGEVTPLQTLDESTAWQVRVALQRETHAAPAAAQPTQ